MALAYCLILTILLFITFADGKPHCGRRVVEDNRIINGVEAKKGSHPWLVSLEFKTRRGWKHKCGGSILNKKWIITAAHCFIGTNDVKKWRIIAGEHDKEVKEASEQILIPEVIVTHEHFDPNTEFESPHDIALIKVKGKIRTNTAFSRTACLPKDSVRFDAHTKCTVAGWGDTYGSSLTVGSDSRLQEYHSTILPMKECNKTAMASYSRITEQMLCLKTEYNSETGMSTGGVCGGDSGGAVLCRVGKYYYIAGVTSFSLKYTCGTSHDVFTRVQFYRKWIKDTMKSYN